MNSATDTNPRFAMPRFRFTAADSSGATHDGTIDAASEEAARSKLAANGLAVRSVSEAGAGETNSVPVPAMSVPAPTFEPPLLVPMPVRRQHSEASESPQRGGRGSGNSPFPIVFSLLALIVSLGTAAYMLSRDPFTGRLNKYDFSTPERAYESSLKMSVNGDIVARLERENKVLAPLAREQLRTLSVEKRREYRGHTLLFVQFTRSGKLVRQVRAFERDGDTGMWRRSPAVDFEIAMGKLPDRLGQEIMEWVTPNEPEDGFNPDIDW